jgi:hypothetical protein
VLLYQAQCLVKLFLRQAIVLSEIDLRLKPELCLTVLPMDMHMHTGFFTGKEVEPKAAFSKHSWAHEGNSTTFGHSWGKPVIDADFHEGKSINIFGSP